VIGADDNKVVCYYYSADEDKIVPCYDKEVPRPAKPASYKIGVANKLSETGVDDFRVDLMTAEALIKELNDLKKKEDEEDEDDAPDAVEEDA